jgi:ABC-type glycerol-3-phosphate transport system substrate-binding protein
MGGTGLPGVIIAGYTGGYGIGAVMPYEGDYTIGAFHPGAKEAVRLIAQWYQEGLLHPTAVAGDAIGPTEIMRIMTDGNIGVTWHVALPGHWKTIFDGLAENDPSARLGFIPMPAGPDGKSYFGGGAGYYGGLVVNSEYSSDMQGRAGKVIDYLFSPEGTDFMFDGIEGIHYTMKDGAMVPNEETRGRDFVGSVSNLIDLVDRSIAWGREANQILADNFYANEKIAVRPTVIGLSTENYTELQLNIGEVVDSYLTKFYTGELDVDKDWSRMTNAIKAAGLDEMMDEVRAFKGM